MKYQYKGDSLATATVNDGGGEIILLFPSEYVELEPWHTTLPQIARMIALGLLLEVVEETPQGETPTSTLATDNDENSEGGGNN